MRLYSDYLKEKYGCKVYKIGLDAGFSCPARCAYCNGNGSRSPYTGPKDSVGKQLSARIEYLKKTKGAAKFIAYFQAFTNTYAPPDKLKKIYDEVLPFKEIVGISIGTRPDAVDREKLELIASYKDRYEVWIEYGLQSVHDRTLKAIKRGHTFGDFLKAVKLARAHRIPVCAHVILGLPGETKEDMLETAKKIKELKIEGIKIHLLHILKGSAFEKLYAEGHIKLLGQDEYVDLVYSFLENLHPDIIVERLTGQGAGRDHIAPAWALDKMGTINKIKERIRRGGLNLPYEFPL